MQLQLFSEFATDLATGTGCAAHMRRDVGVSRLMHMLKTFYLLDGDSQLDQGRYIHLVKAKKRGGETTSTNSKNTGHDSLMNSKNWGRPTSNNGLSRAE